MIAHGWSIARAITGRQKSEVRRFLRRTIFCATHADIVKSYEIMNRRTPVRLVVALITASVLYKVSTLPASIITIWLLSIMTMDLGSHLLRKKVARRPASRLDVPLFFAFHFIVCGSWSVMPLVLEFRSQAEMFVGLIILMGALVSAAMTAVQVPISLLNLLVVAGAMLAPDVASEFGYKPHAGALGALIIKLLFLLNFASLVRAWYLSARREASMREELEKKRRQAEDLAAAKAMFLAHMSHEIRSPLAGVTLMANLLKRLEDVPEDQRQLIEQIDAGGQAILNLLNTVLDYSKIEAGKVRLSPAPTDVGALLEGVVSLFHCRAQEENSRLSMAVNGILPSALMLDETRLRQVLTNLVSNAIRNSPGAMVHLTVGYEDANETLLIEVIDTGRGLDEEMKKHLFMPYEQQTGADSGTGLGLAISHGLINLMGGTIGFRDTPGGGATFWIRIPAPRITGDVLPRRWTDAHMAKA